LSRSDPQIGLAEATARAIADVLVGAGVPGVETGKPGIVERGSNPLEILPMPAVISKVAYVGGVSGGNVFATTVKGANQIAAAMGAGNDPSDLELSDIAKSAFEEAANQMLSSAAGATAAVLRRAVDVGPPETTLVGEAPDVTDVAAPYMTRVSLTVAGETCLFVQLIPQAFVMRMTAAFEDSDALAFDDRSLSGPTLDSSWVHDTVLRLDAELGSARLTADEVLGLQDGAVVVLDRAVEDPIDLYVNGTHYGLGRLLLDDDEWAVVIEELTPRMVAPESDSLVSAADAASYDEDTPVSVDGTSVRADQSDARAAVQEPDLASADAPVREPDLASADAPVREPDLASADAPLGEPDLASAADAVDEPELAGAPRGADAESSPAGATDGAQNGSTLTEDATEGSG